MGESQPADAAARCLMTAQGESREALGQALETRRAYLLLVANRELADDLWHGDGYGFAGLSQQLCRSDNAVRKLFF